MAHNLWRRLLSVCVLASGLISSLAATSANASTSTASLSACSDGSYNLLPVANMPGGVYKWYYNPAGAPYSLRSVGLPAIQRAIEAITQGQNRCGDRRAPKIYQKYMGITSRHPNVSVIHGDCPAHTDGVSVIGWAKFSTSYIGFTCPTRVDGDTVLNAAIGWFVGNDPSRCHGLYDLQGGMTHEGGHIFGLGHVGSGHENQVMHPVIRFCDLAKRKFGEGDLRGLMKRYGRKR